MKSIKVVRHKAPRELGTERSRKELENKRAGTNTPEKERGTERLKQGG